MTDLMVTMKLRLRDKHCRELNRQALDNRAPGPVWYIAEGPD